MGKVWYTYCNICGCITDTFEYDTYGKLISHEGDSFVIFGYNGRDGVVTDKNGLIYMRARYYSPDMRRFINADIIPGQISNAVTLNRFAYANGNPVSFVDPFGLAAEKKQDQSVQEVFGIPISSKDLEIIKSIYGYAVDALDKFIDALTEVYRKMIDDVQNLTKPKRYHDGSWNQKVKSYTMWIDDLVGPSSNLSKALKQMSPDFTDAIFLSIDVAINANKSLEDGVPNDIVATNAAVDVVFGAGEIAVTAAVTKTVMPGAVAVGVATAAKFASLGFIAGSSVPVIGTVIGAAIGLGVGFAAGWLFTRITEVHTINGNSIKGWAQNKLAEIFGN